MNPRLLGPKEKITMTICLQKTELSASSRRSSRGKRFPFAAGLCVHYQFEKACSYTRSYRRSVESELYIIRGSRSMTDQVLHESRGVLIIPRGARVRVRRESRNDQRRKRVPCRSGSSLRASMQRDTRGWMSNRKKKRKKCWSKKIKIKGEPTRRRWRRLRMVAAMSPLCP